MRLVQRAACLTVFFVVLSISLASAQTARVTHNVNLRPEQSSSLPPIRLLTPAEPPLELVEPHVQDGYYHVRTSAGEEGYVWSRYVTISAEPPSAAPPAAPSPPPPPPPPARGGALPSATTSLHLRPRVPRP